MAAGTPREVPGDLEGVVQEKLPAQAIRAVLTKKRGAEAFLLPLEETQTGREKEDQS